MELSQLKRDPALLLAVLGRERVGQHVRCAFHEDRHGSMSVWQGDDGVWLWKCMAGCGQGTVIDAAMLRYRCATPAEAMRVIERELGIHVGRDEDLQEPRLDLARAERLVADAHALLMRDPELQERMLLGKRGIADLGLVEYLRIGFAIGIHFRGWKSWRPTGWVLPITDGAGKLLAVRIHQEGRRDPDSPKCLWAPFGLYPPHKPKHSVQTLWPPPEFHPQPEKLWLCPGELKALAMLGAGCPATSPTFGESSKLPPREIARLRQVKPRHIMIAWDNDSAKKRADGTPFWPGQEWRDRMLDQLRAAGLDAMPARYSQPKPRAPEPPGEVVPPPMPIVQPEGQTDQDGPVALDSAPAEPAVEPPAPAPSHRFANEVYLVDPSAPCPVCGGTDYWDAWGSGGGLVCRKCTPPPLESNAVQAPEPVHA